MVAELNRGGGFRKKQLPDLRQYRTEISERWEMNEVSPLVGCPAGFLEVVFGLQRRKKSSPGPRVPLSGHSVGVERRQGCWAGK